MMKKRMTTEKNSQLQKLAKLLALASSDNDAEALGALRAAARLLRSLGLDWNDVANLIVASGGNGSHSARSHEWYRAMDDVFGSWRQDTAFMHRRPNRRSRRHRE